jgi:ATP-dependent RNA helicase DeaD
MFIAAGRMDGIVPAKIIDLINRHVKGRVEVGRIDLMQKFSFFEVKSEHAQTVLNALSNVKVNGRMVSAEVAETGDGAAASSSEGGRSRGGRKAASSAEGGRGRKKAAPEEGGFRKTERAKRTEEEKAKLKKNRKAAQQEEPKKKKPSREERGYTAPRGRKATKEDWMKFFTPEYKEWKLKGEEPDFSEEGWAKQTKKKK